MGGCLSNSQTKELTRKHEKTTHVSTKKKAHRYNPSFEDLKDLECIICMEITKTSVLTRWWMKVICDNWRKSVKGKCPLRCHEANTTYCITNKLKNALKKCYELCPVWNLKVKPWRLEKHLDSWMDIKTSESSIFVENLHSSTLFKVTLSSWKWSLRKYVKDCEINQRALNRKRSPHFINRDILCYKCKLWDVTFCKTCIKKWLYGELNSITFTCNLCTKESLQSAKTIALDCKDLSEVESSEVYPSHMLEVLNTPNFLIHQ